MSYLTEDKLAILGSAGAIGSNMVQAALTMGLTPNIAMYDPFDKGNEGAAEEIYHCAFPGARVTWTSNVAEAFAGAKYLVSSGGAPRKEGMTREDLLKGNAEIAEQLGLADSDGVVVSSVDPAGPAREAGIRRGDVIVEVDQEEISDSRELHDRLSSSDERALLLIRRGDSQLYVPLARGES